MYHLHCLGTIALPVEQLWGERSHQQQRHLQHKAAYTFHKRFLRWPQEMPYDSWIKIKANRHPLLHGHRALASLNARCSIFFAFISGDYWKYVCMSFWTIKYIGGGCQKHQIFTTRAEQREWSTGVCSRARKKLNQPVDLKRNRSNAKRTLSRCRESSRTERVRKEKKTSK